jgi:hypothetical protein
MTNFALDGSSNFDFGAGWRTADVIINKSCASVQVGPERKQQRI